MTDSASPSTLRRDVLSAYVASGSKVLSWVIVSALVYRRMGEGAFAMLALVRSTVGILNYVAIGLGPALVHQLARLQVVPKPVIPIDDGSGVLAYASPAPQEYPGTPLQRLYRTALSIVTLLACVGIIVSIFLSMSFHDWFRVPAEVGERIYYVVFWMCVATCFRIWSDASGAVIQTVGRISRDNGLIVCTELLWVGLCVVLITTDVRDLANVTFAAAVASVFLLIFRFHFASRVLPITRKVAMDFPAAWELLAAGVLITFAQLADFLYAPVDYILINRLLSAEAVAAYAPAVQIDAGLLLVVGGLAAVLLPKAALAHAAGDRKLLRQYYIRGTLISAALLLAASVVVWALAPWIFRLWLGDEMKPTRVILPLILIHTIVGGSSAVGRSILLGMGKVKPFTVAVLVAGVANVALSYCFVKYLNLGLKGIVLGTIVVVVVRCAIWMPWYVLRSIRNEPAGPVEIAPPTVPIMP